MIESNRFDVHKGINILEIYNLEFSSPISSSAKRVMQIHAIDWTGVCYLFASRYL